MPDFSACYLTLAVVAAERLSHADAANATDLETLSIPAVGSKRLPIAREKSRS
jgi:hypothetical protein